MTIKECIDIVDNIKPNQYTIKDKVLWLSFIEEIIINEVLKTHEGYDGRYDLFEGYSEDKISVTLIVPSPYDRLYTAFLKMKIDESNGETARYNNSAVLYNTYMHEYRKHYNKTHMPIDTTGRRERVIPHKNTVGLSDAEYENLKRDVVNALADKIYEMTSPDVLTDIVNKFVQNNVQMLKGKDGRDGTDGKDGSTPIRGVDYFTNADVKEIANELNTLYSPIRSFVNILGGQNNWIAEDVTDSEGNVIGSRYGQVVNVNNAVITPHSKVDLQVTSEQMVVFYEKDLAFVTENDGGVVTVYCVGNIPEHSYKVQVTVTEVV